MTDLFFPRLLSIGTGPETCSPKSGALATLFYTVALFFAGSLPSMAGDTSLKAEVIVCANIETDIERLKCFDNVTRDIQGRASGNVVVPPVRQKSATTKILMSAGEAELGQKYLLKSQQPATPTTFNFQLLAAYKDSKKRWNFEFDNGQVWQQVEPRYLPRPKELPLPVTISKGVFGSHNLRVEYIGKAVKIRRLK